MTRVTNTVAAIAEDTRPSSDQNQIRNLPPVPQGSSARQLVWSGSNHKEWEILIYRTGQRWEACFFRWAIHHEHAIGSSFDSVRVRAEQRIRALETSHLKAAEWREKLH